MAGLDPPDLPARCAPEIVRLMTLEIRLEMKNRSKIYDINSVRLRHGHKYTKYKMWIMIPYILSNTTAIFEAQVKQH